MSVQEQLEIARQAIDHLHNELDMKTGSTVDINEVRYECHPAVSEEILRLRNALRALNIDVCNMRKMLRGQ